VIHADTRAPVFIVVGRFRVEQGKHRFWATLLPTVSVFEWGRPRNVEASINISDFAGYSARKFTE